MAAQNAHDIAIVGEIILDSPDFFWITEGAPVWGREAALLRFKEKYRGTWVLDPQFEKIKVTSLAENVARLFAPAVFTIAPPTQTAQPRSFLITQLYVMTAMGWKERFGSSSCPGIFSLSIESIACAAPLNPWGQLSPADCRASPMGEPLCGRTGCLAAQVVA